MCLFINTGKSFCLCQLGRTDPLCTNSYKCKCFPDSIRAGTWKNKSICVCPAHKLERCYYLKNDLCEQSHARRCDNRGQYIPRDIRIPADHPMICSCPHEFHADKYHRNETRVDILIAMPDIEDSLLRHFVTVNSHIPSRSYYSSKERSPHKRATTFKRISFDNDEMKMY